MARRVTAAVSEEKHTIWTFKWRFYKSDKWFTERFTDVGSANSAWLQRVRWGDIVTNIECVEVV